MWKILIHTASGGCLLECWYRPACPQSRYRVMGQKNVFDGLKTWAADTPHPQVLLDINTHATFKGLIQTVRLSLALFLPNTPTHMQRASVRVLEVGSCTNSCRLNRERDSWNYGSSGWFGYPALKKHRYSTMHWRKLERNHMMINPAKYLRAKCSLLYFGVMFSSIKISAKDREVVKGKISSSDAVFQSLTDLPQSSEGIS